MFSIDGWEKYNTLQKVLSVIQLLVLMGCVVLLVLQAFMKMDFHIPVTGFLTLYFLLDALLKWQEKEKRKVSLIALILFAVAFILDLLA